MRKHPGFSFIEAMTSVAIIAIIATITVFDLRKSRRTDELNTAARVVAADIRSLQSRAFSATNIKSCPALSDGKMIVCENSTSGCASAPQCQPAPPLTFGARFMVNTTTYDLYSEVELSKYDALETDATEVFMRRKLDIAGAPNVTVFALSAGSPSDVVFFRQNGNMQINACNPWVCPSPLDLTITLKHSQSGATKSIYMDTATGRVSIQ